MSAGMEARFRGRFGAFALDVAFTAPDRGVTALFGHSGCGKTTVLRCVAGLNRTEEGYFSLAGEVWRDATIDRPTHKRPIGYVFQEASLFPHLSVRRNLDYGRERAVKRGVSEVIRFDDAVDLLGLTPLLDRDPSKLSGGERQRVAIGRALLAQPRLLLMDEPLAALDRFAKEEILPYLERLRDSLEIPVLHVSHDIAEVERLADHVILIRKGRVTAAGPLETLQADPSLPIARLAEAGVTMAAEVIDYDPTYDLTTLAAAGGRLIVPGRLGGIGSRRRARVAAGDVSLTRRPASDSSILNILPARIVSAEKLDESRLVVALALGSEGTGARMLSHVTRRSWDALALSVGGVVYAQVKSVALAAPDPADQSPIPPRTE